MDLLNNNGNQEDKQKKGQGFTILSGDSTDGHGGYGVGALSLDNIAPVIVDIEAGEAYVDMGAMHARSQIEKRIKFTPNREDSPNGKPYWLVWVTIERKSDGPYYHGVTACEMKVDTETRRGYKNLAEHVNKMDKSLKGKIMVEHMDEKSKQILGSFLKNHNVEIWKRSSDELRQGLLGDN